MLIVGFLILAEHPSVVSVFPNKGKKLHTTRSWEFLGLEQNGVISSDSIWKKARFGEDTIIGNLDTGKRLPPPIYLLNITFFSDKNNIKSAPKPTNVDLHYNRPERGGLVIYLR